MDSWVEVADRLRGQFIFGTAGVLDRMSTLVERLADYPMWRLAHGTLAELRRGFRRLSASGGRYGYLGISEAGAEGDRRCAALLAARRMPGGPDLARLRRLLRNVDAELAAVAAGRPGGDLGRTAAEAVPGAARVAGMCQLAAPAVRARQAAGAMR
jgi:hypothetical protein